MDLNLSQKIKKLKVSGRIPNSLLLVNYNGEDHLGFLLKVAESLEGKPVSEALGNAISLGSDAEALNIKVDDVRAVLKKLSLQNWKKEERRYVLLPFAEKLNAQSSNALLKSIEEPPEGTHFLLMAPTRKNLLKTILSRSFVVLCQSQKDKAFHAEDNLFYKVLVQKENLEEPKLSRVEALNMWEDFKSLASHHFMERAYSGEVDRRWWFELFDFIENLESEIESHMDVKWIFSKIERFHLNV